MLYDLSLPPQDISLLLYADDVIFYTSVKRPIDADIILQPFIDKWPDGAVSENIKFSTSKYSSVVFSRAHKLGDNPILFLSGHRIPSATNVKFLGVTLDSKLL